MASLTKVPHAMLIEDFRGELKKYTMAYTLFLPVTSGRKKSFGSYSVIYWLRLPYRRDAVSKRGR